MRVITAITTQKEICQKRGKHILEIFVVVDFLGDTGKEKTTYDNSRGTGTTPAYDAEPLRMHG